MILQKCVIIMKENNKRWAPYAKLLKESEHGKPPLKEENEDRFFAQDIESLFIISTVNII